MKIVAQLYRNKVSACIVKIHFLTLNAFR